MESVIEEILKDDFVEYSKVYKLAKIKGVKKKEVKEIKKKIGAKTICIEYGDEKKWLWYIPKNIWNRFSPEK